MHVHEARQHEMVRQVVQYRVVAVVTRVCETVHDVDDALPVDDDGLLPHRTLPGDRQELAGVDQRQLRPRVRNGCQRSRGKQDG